MSRFKRVRQGNGLGWWRNNKAAPTTSENGGTDLVTESTKLAVDVDAPYEGPLLAVDDLEVAFPTLDGVVHAVRGVSWDLYPGETLAIVGESGSGKSVSAMALLGLLPKSAEISGTARFKGAELLGRSPQELNRIRGRHLAMIFQDPMTSLNPVYTAGWQVAEALLTHTDLTRQEARKRAVELLDVVGIPDPEERARAYPHELSGGMRQRVVIAMAMANDPDVMIADEPTTALDVTVQAQVLDALRRAQREIDAALVLITHDLGVVAGMADRVNVMYAGRVVESGTADEIYYEPRMPYTLGLLGALPRLDMAVGEKLTPIRGTPPSLLNLPPGCPFSPRCPLVRPDCVEEEPELVPTEDEAHHSACFYWRELSATDVASEIYETTAVDDLDPLAVATGQAFEAELEVREPERQDRPAGPDDAEPDHVEPDSSEPDEPAAGEERGSR